jgi:hypothetical protein
MIDIDAIDDALAARVDMIIGAGFDLIGNPWFVTLYDADEMPLYVDPSKLGRFEILAYIFEGWGHDHALRCARLPSLRVH